MRGSDRMTVPLIRRASTGDALRISQLCSDALGYDSTEDAVLVRLTALLHRDTECIVVAELDGQVVGFAHACEYHLLYQPPMMNLMGIAVDAQFRGRGIGKALLAVIEETACNRGFAGIRVISGIGREDAHSFYRAIGFADAGASVKFFKKL